MTDQPTLRHLDWARLLTPRRVAVIGASDREGTQQRAQWLQIHERLTSRGAEVIPVHPTKPTICGTPAVPTVLDVPGDVDVAAILVRDPLPPLRDCRAKGVGFAIVFSAGFSELGSDQGRAAEAAMAELTRDGMHVLGPNTNLNLYEPWPDGYPGRRLAVVTQSGYQGRPITQADVLGVGIELWATLGNEADVEWADVVGHLAQRPGVGAIATYVEGFKDGRTFLLAADTAAQAGVPIVCIKVGRSEEGQAMAVAHTGHMTGADAVHDAVFEQYGIVRVDDIDEIIEISAMFCHIDPGAGRGGVAVYAMSGGTASHVVDLLGAAGVPVPCFDPSTIEVLDRYVPAFLRHDNPVDSGGVITATPANIEVLEAMRRDPAVSVLFAPITGVFPGMSDALARDLVALHERGGTPVVTAWLSPWRDDPSYRALCQAGVPLFHSLSGAVRGLAALRDHTALRRDYRSPFPLATPSTHVREARALLAGRTIVTEPTAKRLLAAYGIPTVPEVLVTQREEVLDATGDVGYPVVMKVVAPDLPHRSDHDLVRTGIANDDTALRTYDDLLARVADLGDAGIEGVVVQETVRDAVAEVIIGIADQPPFGPTVVYGMGGVFTEVFDDVSFGVPPFDETWARRMVERTRSRRLLDGSVRGVAADVDAVVAAILAVQQIAVDLGNVIAELDVNPLMVLAKGRGAIAVDALAVVRPLPGDEATEH